jgi:hypothetical protein
VALLVLALAGLAAGRPAQPAAAQPVAAQPAAAQPAAVQPVAGHPVAAQPARPARPAATPHGSATSCTAFALAAVRRHVTVRSMPAACQGLGRAEVNAAVGRALRGAVAGVRGKTHQRQRIARDSRYLVGLVRAASAPGGPPAGTAPLSGPASRAALSLGALAAWLVTVGLGLSMLARGVTRAGWHRAGPRRGQPAPARNPALNLAHLGLALASLLIWIGYLATGVTGLAWAGCALLLPVAGLGMALVFRTPDRPPAGQAVASGVAAGTGAGGTGPAPAAARPPGPAAAATAAGLGRGAATGAGALTVAAHITAASLTILLAVLAAVGSG